MNALAPYLIGAILGLVAGMFIGHRIWAPKWFDTSEGIDRKFRRLNP